MKQATIAIHESQKPDEKTGAVITPIYQTTTFAQDVPGALKAGYDYSRSGNPTRTVLENVLAKMEGGTHGFTFASGMGALTTLIMGFMQSGDHIVIGDDVYGGTFRLFDKVLKKFGILASYIDMTEPENVRDAIQPTTKMVYLETPTNPLLKLADLEAIINIAKDRGIFTCVDNTFATPILQNPITMGADCVLHSTTKYINGHSDVVGGALIVNTEEHADIVHFHQNSLGATPDPFACWLTLRGLKTLKVRMEAHVAGAMKVAAFLEKHDAVEEVIYPGLSSFPQYALAQKQMRAPGGMIAMRLKGDEEMASNFLKKLKYFTLAESLGGIESLVEIPSIMTHASISPENRAKLGITDTLIRLSVGIEDPEDLIVDLENALSS
jgi:cystathionine gamma-lyase